MGDARLVLVLGATGPAGGRVLPRLLAAGYRLSLTRPRAAQAGTRPDDRMRVVRYEQDGRG